MTAKTAHEEPAIEALRRKLAAVTLELGNTQLELMDAKDDLETCQADLDAATSSLKEKELELQNTKDVLANTKSALQAAQLDQVLSRPHERQEVFVVLKFRHPQPLPIGEYQLFMRQHRAVKRTLDRFKARNPELDAVEMERLRRHNFALKEKKTEEEMVEYIARTYNTNTQA
ncbi:hypothetical protein BGZ80_001296 [Entomortierella chlamydospora]|uniref:Uncharacterized protein n=1 Tax=Entomortierella chlamydospora TaxID=101097 RepID=A0A9P6SXU3_9FUNG|nr:hypothetical protein BGZ80_001296 [Entomortierella chlamydospora]